MGNKIFKIGSKDWSVGLGNHTWSLYKGDILFLEEIGEISHYNSVLPCYRLKKIYYQSVGFNGVVSMCWLNLEKPMVNPVFCISSSYYNMAEAIKAIERYNDPSTKKSISDSLGNLLIDITTEYERDKKLELIGI